MIKSAGTFAFTLLLLFLLTSSARSVLAQSQPDQQPSPSLGPQSPVTGGSTQSPLADSTASLPDGAPVKLLTTRAVWSADTCPGDAVEFEVAEDVRVADTLVIAKGDNASGSVIKVERKRRMARGGELEINIDSVHMVNGQKAALRKVEDAHGGGRARTMALAMVATGIAYPAAPFWLLMHGRDITLPKGTAVTAYIDGNVLLNLAAFRQVKVQSKPTVAAEPSPTAGRVALDVTSNVKGAEITLDGKPTGQTPSCMHIEPGPHTVRVTEAGHKPKQRKINASTQSVKVSLDF